MTTTSTSPVSATIEPRRLGMLSAGSAMAFVILIGTVSLFSDMTYEGGRSLTGQYLQLLGSSALAVGIAAGAGEFLGYALRLVTGLAADRTGAYWRIAILGYSIQLFALPALAFVGRWELAVGLMFLERIGKAIRHPSRDAMLSYATKEMGRGWGYGLHEAMDQIGAFLGPTLMAGALLLRSSSTNDLQGYQDGFKILFVPALLAIVVLLTARWIFPRPRELEVKVPKVSAQGLTRKFWLYVLATGFVAAGFADFALMAFHFKTTALAADFWIPMMFAAAMLVDAAAALIAGRAYDSRGYGVVIVVFAISAVFAPFVFLGGLELVLIGLGLWGIGLAAQESLMKAALADMVPSHRRAYGFGLFSTVFGVFWFAGSALMGWLYDQNVVYLVVFSVAIQLVALPIFWLAKRAPAPAAE